MSGVDPEGRSAPWRPQPTAPFAWPADFGTRFTIFVDAEEEFDWSAPLRRDATAVASIRAVPAGHRHFADAGVGLTWLIDHPIARDPRAVAVLGETLSDGRSAIGTQLHPWVNPPYEEEITAANSFVGNLPRALEAAKLRLLTDLIEQSFGQRPLAYRAGRYGAGPNTFALLAECGYRIDTSIRARYDFGAKSGPDYSRAGNHAWRTAAGPVELPLTTIFTGRVRSATLYRAFERLPHGPGIAARTGLVQRVALTPEEMPLAEVKEAIRVAHGDGLRLFNLAFHSPSLEPGHTPYVRDAADLAKFWAWWDGVFDLFALLGVKNASLDELLAAIG